MWLVVAALGGALSFANVDAGQSPPPSRPASASGQAFETAFVSVAGIELGRFVDDLELRTQFVSDIETDWSATERGPGQTDLLLFVEARPGPPPQVVLRVVTRDGRLYRRVIDARPEEVRVIASVAANVILAVAQGQVAPEREGVVIPDDIDEAGLQSLMDEAEQDGPSTEATFTDETGEGAAQRDDDGVPETPAGSSSSAGLADAPPRAFVMLGLDGGPRLALGPQYGGVFAGGGLGVDVRVLGRARWLVGVAITSIGRAASGPPGADAVNPEPAAAEIAVLRHRVALTGGYLPRWGRFEFGVAAGPLAEATDVRRDGAPADLIERSRSPWLFGGLAVLEPSFLIPGAHESLGRGLFELRVRSAVTLSYAVAADGRAVAINAGPAGRGAELVRMGGAELAVSLGLSMAWGLR